MFHEELARRWMRESTTKKKNGAVDREMELDESDECELTELVEESADGECDDDHGLDVLGSLSSASLNNFLNVFQIAL